MTSEQRAGSYSDRSLILYLGSEVERMGETLDASEDTQRDAIRLCGDVLRSDYDYDAVDSVAGACFYLACTRQGEPISLPDIAEQSRKSQKNIQHLGATLMGELDIQPNPVEPDTYLEDGVEHFEFTESQQEEAFALLERVKERNLHSGLAPTTVAGAILYAIARKHYLHINQKEVAEFVGKSTVSIRNNFRDALTLADDVPVDVLPPQTVNEALSRIKTQFQNLPAIYAEEAKKLVESNEVEPGPSRAGLAGGAYLAVVSDENEDITAGDISSAVGVSSQTISKHRRRFIDD